MQKNLLYQIEVKNHFNLFDDERVTAVGFFKDNLAIQS